MFIKMKSGVVFLIFAAFVRANPEENEGVVYANKCEVCKILAVELENRLRETGKSKEVLEIGYSLDDVKPKNKIQYHKSELRLEESKEGVCDRILEYNIHKERGDSTRFAKGMSQTFRTLHGLVDKGVKVDLGIPFELWDKPSAEITNLKSQCENMLENFEDVIEKWYLEGGDLDGAPLSEYLCVRHVLSKDESTCLREKGETGDKTSHKETVGKTQASTERKKSNPSIKESGAKRSQSSAKKTEL